MSVLDQASLVVIPSGYKAGTIFSQVPTDGTGDLDFARSTTGTRVNPDGLIEDVSWNLVTYSNSNFVVNSCTIAYNNTSNPDGNNEAYKATVTATSGSFVRTANVSFPSVANFSVFMKYGDNQWYQIMNAGKVQSYVNVDIQNGAFGTYGTDVSNLLAEDYGDGWYRISGTFSSTSGVGTLRLYNSNSSSAGWAGATGVIGSYYFGYGMQVSKGSLKTYLPTQGSLVNYPRIDYTNGCGQLLLEPQRTNTCVYNSDYSNWANAGANPITDDAIQSPKDGVLAQKITVADSYGQHYFRQILNGHTVGEDYTFSVFAKAGELDSLTLRLYQGTNGNVVFDLTNGIITSGTNGKIEDYGNGWYRCSGYFVAQNTYLYPYLYVLAGNAQGDGTSGMYWWNAQLEEGSYATSAIETESSSVTRTADNASLSNNAILPTDYPFTLMAEVDISIAGTGTILSLLNDATTNAYITIEWDKTNTRFFANNRIDGTQRFAYGTGGASLGVHKVALYIPNNTTMQLYVDGALEATTTYTSVAFVAAINDLLIGQKRIAADDGNRIGNSMVYLSNDALTNTQLAALTTL